MVRGSQTSRGHSSPHCRARLPARDPNRRRESKQQTRREGERSDEAEHTPVGSEIQKHRIGSRAEECDQQPAQRLATLPTLALLHRREQQTLNQQLPHETTARRAERLPHRDLAFARARTRHQ